MKDDGVGERTGTMGNPVDWERMDGPARPEA
mgnify:CR=1 FL=1